MKKSSFRHYSLDQASRKTLQVQSFGGVDYSTQKFLVANNHAIDELNFIYKDGVIQKRNGYEELYKVNSFKYIAKDFDNGVVDNVVLENPTNFNGIWQFTGEDGQRHIVAHIGKLLYVVTDIDSSKIEFTPITTGENKVLGDDGLYHQTAYEFLNEKSFAVVGGNKLWFFGGNKFMCLRFIPTSNESSFMQLFSVENSDFTPIPTTTISITYKNSITSGRASLDKTNLLTMWRKNKLLSGVGKNEDEKTKTEYFDYTLDAPLICKNKEKDMADFSISIEERGTIDNG